MHLLNIWVWVDYRIGMVSEEAGNSALEQVHAEHLLYIWIWVNYRIEMVSEEVGN